MSGTALANHNLATRYVRRVMTEEGQDRTNARRSRTTAMWLPPGLRAINSVGHFWPIFASCTAASWCAVADFLWTIKSDPNRKFLAPIRDVRYQTKIWLLAIVQSPPRSPHVHGWPCNGPVYTITHASAPESESNAGHSRAQSNRGEGRRWLRNLRVRGARSC